MSLMILSHHLGLMWVAIETATLSSAPLLYFNRNQRSLEAVWKYLLIGSVGVALALFGSFFLAYAMLVGVLAGTYSSVYIASPILLWMKKPPAASEQRGAVRPATVQAGGGTFKSPRNGR